MFSARLRTASTAATADHHIFTVWNPHSTQRIKLVSILFAEHTTSSDNHWRPRRITTQGTSGASVVGTSHDTHPAPSGALLEVGPYSVQPTILTTAGFLGMFYYGFPQIGVGFNLVIPGGFVIPPGTGLGYAQELATAVAAMDITVCWLEDF